MSTATSTNPIAHDLVESRGIPFVAGTNNQLTKFSLDQISAGDTRFNPVVYVGLPGFGKSLLLRTICNNDSAVRSLYLSSADFARDFATAVETDSVDEFRNSFNEVDVLCLDDIQQLNSKPAAQNELCFLLDTFVATVRLLVVTCSVTPQQNRSLSPHLQSRLSSGLTVPIGTIDVTDARRILAYLAVRYRLDLSNEVIDFLAQTATNQDKVAPAPLLNHYLSQLIAHSEATNRSIDLGLAIELFATSTATKEPNLSAIVQAVGKSLNLKPSDIRSGSRKQPVVRARCLAMLLARTLTTNSLEEIGRFFANRDHSTVLHACRRAKMLLKEDRDMQSIWHELQCSISSK